MENLVNIHANGKETKVSLFFKNILVTSLDLSECEKLGEIK